MIAPVAPSDHVSESVAAVPPVAEPELARPPAGGAIHGLEPVAKRAFKGLNRWFMGPVHRAGLGPWIASPIGGYMLLLRVRGRKSGIMRETPLNYLVAEGSVWVVAGFGPATEWYRNLLADPRVEAWMPGRRVAGTATEVRAPAVRARILPALMRATGLPSFLGGVNPWADDDAAMLEALDFVPLIRIDADEGWLDAGADDPGGTAWVWRQGVVLAATVGIAWGIRRLLR
jgi:deazaflavin-dependent oxidoreductase (nitroreductase family)